MLETATDHPTGGRRLVKQAEQGMSDINEIVRRAMAGQMPSQNAQRPRYGDFSQGLDFHQAVELVREAQEQFDRLPWQVKRACEQDPALFIDMCQDPESVRELVDLGLAVERLPERAQLPDELKPKAPEGEAKPGETPPST